MLPILVALAAAGCARQQQSYVIDPSTGQPVPVVMQQQTQPQYPQQIYQQPPSQAVASGERGLFDSWKSAPRPQYARQAYGQQTYEPPAPGSERGLLTSPQNASVLYAYQPPPQPNAIQYYGPQYVAPRTGGPYVAPPKSFAMGSLY